jgi:hypothetical protein
MDPTRKERRRVLEAYRAAILKVFRGAVSPETVDSALVLGDEDPSGWATTEAFVVIRTDMGIPNALDSVPLIEAWVRIDEAANAALAKHKLRVYSEPINGGVSAVWRA